MSAEREKLLRKMALLYAENEGDALREEARGAESGTLSTARLDKKLRGAIFRLKYRVHIRAAAGIVAACLALAVILPQVMHPMTGGGGVATAPPSPAPAAMPYANGAAYADEDFAAVSEFLPDAGGQWGEFEDGLLGGFEGDLIAPTADMLAERWESFELSGEIIPLTFPLPEGFEYIESGLSPDSATPTLTHDIVHRLSYGQTQTVTLLMSHFIDPDYSVYFNLHWDVFNHYNADLFSITHRQDTAIFYRSDAENGAIVLFYLNGIIYDIRGDTGTATLLRLAEAILESE